METQYVRGDVVCLKSNPNVPMSVVKTISCNTINDVLEILVEWLDTNNQVQTHKFFDAQLKIWEPL